MVAPILRTTPAAGQRWITRRRLGRLRLAGMATARGSGAGSGTVPAGSRAGPDAAMNDRADRQLAALAARRRRPRRGRRRRLHVAEERAFVDLLERARAVVAARRRSALQAATYVAQAAIWLIVLHRAGAPVPFGYACALSLQKLFVDQALPSAGTRAAPWPSCTPLEQRGAAAARGHGCGRRRRRLLLRRLRPGPRHRARRARRRRARQSAGRRRGAALRALRCRARDRRARAVRPAAGAVAAATASRCRASGAPCSCCARPTRASRTRPAAAAARDAAAAVDLRARRGDALGPDPRARRGARARAPCSRASCSPRCCGPSASCRADSAPSRRRPSRRSRSPASRWRSALSATLLFRGLSFWLPMLPGLAIARAVLSRGRHARARRPAAAWWSLPARQVAARARQHARTASPATRRARRLEQLRTERDRRARRAEPARRALEPAAQPAAAAAAVRGRRVGRHRRVGRRRHRPRDRRWRASASATRASTARRSAAAQLRARVQIRATVLRDGAAAAGAGAARSCPATSCCCRPAASCRPTAVLLEATDFFVSEAVLTGESFPVEKRPGPCRPRRAARPRAPTASSWARTCAAARARCLVVAHRRGAPSSARSPTASTLRPPETEFDRGIRRFGYLLLDAPCWS